ncbi:hypothetical protein ACPB9J_33385 [Streptomyces lavendulocolor]|uniref:hypothetical protein n=1 Tax=Streptomyces lavendulocolor TaxID=67316 RepID=UPI003C2CB3C3
MTTPRNSRGRGRGRPAVFDTTLQTRYLTAITTGMRLGEAAHHIGISVNVPTRLARTDPQFATRLADARAAGRKARADTKPHDESHYNNDSCRHPDCATAARKGRAHRRRTAAARTDSRDDHHHAAVIDLEPATPKSPTSFLLLKAS